MPVRRDAAGVSIGRMPKIPRDSRNAAPDDSGSACHWHVIVEPVDGHLHDVGCSTALAVVKPRHCSVRLLLPVQQKNKTLTMRTRTMQGRASKSTTVVWRFDDDWMTIVWGAAAADGRVTTRHAEKMRQAANVTAGRCGAGSGRG